MRVLIESYNNVTQNVSGGMQVRISDHVNSLRQHNVEAVLFNKWTHKINDFDILHIFKLNTDDYQLVKYAKRNDIPVVISSVVPLEGAWKIRANLFLGQALSLHTGYGFFREMLSSADAVIVETVREAEFLMVNYGIARDRVHLIANGVDITLHTGNKDLIADRIKTSREIILQVGRFDSNKNQLAVIRAMKGSDIPVVFIGGADAFEPAYFVQCQREATSNMHFLGWLKNDDPLLASAYVQARVLALPSFKETFGIALIEGGVAGANMVSARGLPILDQGLRERCVLVSPGDIGSIKAGLHEAYGAPKDPSLPGFIRSQFSRDVAARKHIELYNSVLRNSKV